MTVREATNSVSFLPPPPITLSSLGTSPPQHNQDQVSPSNVSFPINGAMILPVCTVLGLSPMHFHTPYAMSCLQAHLGSSFPAPGHLFSPLPLQSCPSPLKSFQPTFTEHLLSDPMLAAEN